MPDTAPAPQFADLHQQTDAAQIGMWVFLSTEVLFFGGLIMLYDAYRMGSPEAFAVAGRHTKILIGTINTAVLLTSSFAVAWALTTAKAGQRRLTTVLLCISAFLGVVFIGLKGLEYTEEYLEHLVPGVNFIFSGPYSGGVELFYTFYFIATGLHALHLTIGVILLLIMARRAARGEFSAHYHSPLTVVGLYWHFVDSVWVVLFALIYLPGRNGS
jgi:cytochrome c oxidase subunit 3